MVKYAPVEGRGWQLLPEFLSMKKAIINIQNNDERCFGYAVIYFLEREQLPENFAIKHLFIRKKCSSVSISIRFRTLSHPTMPIYTRISSR